MSEDRLRVQKSCSGIILAGGLNTRFSGKDKAFITVGGIRLMDRLHQLFQETFGEVIIVTNDPVKYLEWDALIVTDLLPIRSSLTGIHAGLFFTQTPHAFIAACDTPFLQKEVVEAIVGALTDGIDVVIPETAAGLEPLCAGYSIRCLEPIRRHLKRNKLKIQMFFNKMRVRRVPEQALRRLDPHLVSFININSPPDLVRADAVWSAISKPNSINNR
jgi:molybdopterin-guanine dinucleotide biosynthesis protein A